MPKINNYVIKVQTVVEVLDNSGRVVGDFVVHTVRTATSYDDSLEKNIVGAVEDANCPASHHAEAVVKIAQHQNENS